MRTELRWMSAVAFGILMAGTMGCSAEDDEDGQGESIVLEEMVEVAIDDTAKLIEFALMGSAPNAYYNGIVGISLGSFAADESTNGCPSLTEDGTTTTIEGDCTDEFGSVWTGKAVSKGSFASATITYTDFGLTGPATCDTSLTTQFAYNGKMTFSASGSFTVDLKIDVDGYDDDSCEPVQGVGAWFYKGKFVEEEGESEEESGPTTWNGSGEVGYDFVGKVQASTDDEVIDDEACETEAASGTTTFEGGGSTAVITYDGATACSTASIVTWTLNGDDQGEVAGIACDVAVPEGGGVGGRLVFAVLTGIAGALMLAWRRAR